MIRALGMVLALATAASASAQTGAAMPPDDLVTRQTFGLATDLCLQNLRTPNAAPDSFRASGFALTPADEGTFNFSKNGVHGFLAPLLPTEWCWIASDTLSLEIVQAIGFSRAAARYPAGVSGPAQRGMLANGCPSLTVLAGSRITTLEFRNAQFFTGCDSPESGGIFFQ